MCFKTTTRFQAKISAEGCYQELQASGIDFAKFLGTPEETAAVDPDGNATSGETDNGPDGTPTVATATRDDSDIPRDRPGENDVSPSSCAVAEKKQGAGPSGMAETRSSGNISKNVYASYFSAVGSTCNVFCFFFMYVLTQVLTTGGDYWISYW